MQLRVSPCVGLVTPDVGRAAQFYVETMGMGIEDECEGVELLAGPLHIYLDPGPMGQPVFELLVTDLEEAFGKFKFYGFETVTWNGPGRANLIRDPFGLVFNVFEYEEDEYLEVCSRREGMFCPDIGALTTDLKGIAEFYSTVLQQPANGLADGSVLVSGGDLGLRFFEGSYDTSALWLSHSADVAGLVRSGCECIEDGGRVIADPFGLFWVIEKRTLASHALIHPL